MAVKGCLSGLLLIACVMVPSGGVNVPNVTMNNGAKMPAIALGTYLGFDQNGIVKSVNKTLRNVILRAIDVGYRHFDTAEIYDTEEEVGEAIRMKIAEGVVKREDIFVTTKLWNTHHKREQVHQAMNETLTRLGMDYVDLYLMHWPIGLNEDYTFSDVDYMETYRGLEDVAVAGKAAAIGVSNFNITQLKRVIEEAILPVSALQIEIHIQNVQSDLVSYALSKDLVVMGYSPFGGLVPRYGVKLHGPPFNDPILRSVAEQHEITPAQTVLRWLVERNIVPVVKTVTPARLLENINIFDVSLFPPEVAEINKCDTHTRFTLPSFWQSHKYYPFEHINNPLPNPFPVNGNHTSQSSASQLI